MWDPLAALIRPPANISFPFSRPMLTLAPLSTDSTSIKQLNKAPLTLINNQNKILSLCIRFFCIFFFVRSIFGRGSKKQMHFGILLDLLFLSLSVAKAAFLLLCFCISLSLSLCTHRQKGLTDKFCFGLNSDKRVIYVPSAFH